jgi:hypothetical protein
MVRPFLIFFLLLRTFAYRICLPFYRQYLHLFVASSYYLLRNKFALLRAQLTVCMNCHLTSIKKKDQLLVSNMNIISCDKYLSLFFVQMPEKFVF